MSKHLIPIASPEAAAKFVAKLHAHEVCPVCHKPFGNCQHPRMRGFPIDKIPHTANVSRPWGYSGPVRLVSRKPPRKDQVHVRVWVRCRCQKEAMLVELRHSENCPKCGSKTNGTV